MYIYFKIDSELIHTKYYKFIKETITLLIEF